MHWSLTRGYSTEEGATYGIDPCPTTAEQVVRCYGGIGVALKAPH